MTKNPIKIIGAGDVECSLCPPKNCEKDGVSIEMDGAESELCWKHLQGVVRMARSAWAQRDDKLPAPPREIHVNGCVI